MVSNDNQARKGYELSGIVYRYLAKKVTENLRMIYLDIDFEEHRMLLTAFYQTEPTDIELELFDDIVTDSNAPIPDYFIDKCVKLTKEHNEDENHDYLIFAFFDESDYDL
jgi:hypothetical protein